MSTRIFRYKEARCGMIAEKTAIYRITHDENISDFRSPLGRQK